MAIGQEQTVNGIDVAGLKKAILEFQKDAGKGEFRFRAENRWLGGGQNRSRIGDFYGARQENSHGQTFELNNDEPAVFLGKDKAPNPVEFVLHALGGCLTSTLVYHAAARGIPIESVESVLEGDMDVRGFLGVEPNVPKGYQAIRVRLRVKSDAPADRLQELAEFSPVFNTLMHGVPVELTIEKA